MTDGDAGEWEGPLDAADADRFADVYDELRALAGGMFNGSVGTLQPTALVHEAYLKLRRSGRPPVNDAEHLRALAARVMRQVMVDHARRRNLARRSWAIVVHLNQEPSAGSEVDLLHLDDAIRRLHERDPRAASVVDCRIFAGLTIEQTALALEIAPRTVDRDWRFARAWLVRELGPG